jgi:PadR family transcriptional regulator PadR
MGAMPGPPTNVLPGTLDLLILKALSLGRLHGYGVLQRVQEMTQDGLAIEQGALYPALARLEREGCLSSGWGLSGTGRQAKFYALTPAGRVRLHELTASWTRMVTIMAVALRTRSSGI